MNAGQIQPDFSNGRSPGHSLSIIINNFNYDRYLEEAIESAITQFSPADEIIVVDDGSTDNSAAILQRYTQAIIPIFKRNGGQTSTLNTGFAHSRGEILCFLDADDVLDPTATQTIRESFSNPEVVKVHWPLVVIGPHGRPTGKRKPSHRLHEGSLLSRLLEVGPDDPTWVPTSGNAWRRSFLAQIFPLPEPERGAGVGSASADACMSMLTPLYGKVARVDTPQGRYRVHGSNDHSCMAFEKRLNRDVELFEQRASLLEEHCRRRGIEANPVTWRENAWCHKLKRALALMEQVIPAPSPFLLVDDLSWQMPASEKRLAIPFLESNGQYAGAPANSREAITQLERMRGQGAEYIAVAWPSFWWFDHYPDFARHLEDRYLALARTPEVAIFELANSGTCTYLT